MERTMKENLKTIKAELKRQITILSVSATVIINLIYLGYLTYSLGAGVGVREINIALMAGTVIFLAVYLFFRLGNREEKKQKVKTTKKFYKNFKLITKLFTSLTALYALYTAQDANFIARVFAVIGAVMLALRLIGELLSFLIKRKVKKKKEQRALRRQEKMAAKAHREEKMAAKAHCNEYEIPELDSEPEACLLSDTEEG